MPNREIASEQIEAIGKRKSRSWPNSVELEPAGLAIRLKI